MDENTTDQFEKNAVFIGNLPYETSPEELREAFKDFGEITDLYKQVGKGIGFITFSDDAAAEQAINAMNGQTIGTRQIFVAYKRKRTERPSNGGFRGGDRRSGGGSSRFNNRREGGGNHFRDDSQM